MDFGNMVIQQHVTQENLRSEGNAGKDQVTLDGASHRVIPTERDATARRVALNGNLSFD